MVKRIRRIPTIKGFLNKRIGIKKEYLRKLDPLDYIESRGFLLWINTVNGLVYRHSQDSFLCLYVQLQFDTVQLIYNDDFEDPLYTGSPLVEEFEQVLQHALYN